jgi:hypothetical protein
MTAPELKALWQSLYAKEPPPFNKTYFVKRLAYRIQELEYGVDSRPLERQLEAHARQQMDMQGKPKRKSRRETRDASHLWHTADARIWRRGACGDGAAAWLRLSRPAV